MNPIFDILHLTPAQKAGENIINLGLKAVKATADAYKRGYDLIWSAPNNLTPQEVIDGMGTKALEFFTSAEIIKNSLIALDPRLLPEPYCLPAPQPLNPELIDGVPTGRMIVG